MGQNACAGKQKKDADGRRKKAPRADFSISRETVTFRFRPARPLGRKTGFWRTTMAHSSRPQAVTVKIKRLRDIPVNMLPQSATPGSVGLDLRADLEADAATVAPGARIKIKTGVAVEVVEPGVAGFVFSRSGLGAKHGLTVAQGVGVIDPDYRGEIIVWLLNTSETAVEIRNRQRVAQLLFLPAYTATVVDAEELSDTSRGDGGFGHTGSV